MGLLDEGVCVYVKVVQMLTPLSHYRSQLPEHMPLVSPLAATSTHTRARAHMHVRTQKRVSKSLAVYFEHDCLRTGIFNQQLNTPSLYSSPTRRTKHTHLTAEHRESVPRYIKVNTK